MNGCPPKDIIKTQQTKASNMEPGNNMLQIDMIANANQPWQSMLS